MELSLVSTEIRQNLMPLQLRSAGLFFVCFCWLLELENCSIKQPVLTLFSFRGVVFFPQFHASNKKAAPKLKQPNNCFSIITGGYLYVKGVPINFHYKRSLICVFYYICYCFKCKNVCI